MSKHLHIRTHFDLICPWCLIGKRHLQQAIAELTARQPEVAINLEWRSHVLLADCPESGVPYQAFYEKRLGSPAAVAARRAQVQAAAQTAGLKLNFEQIEWMPNTLAAHLLIDQLRYRLGAGQLAELIDRLFAAYFIDGRNIGDAVLLRDIASEAGVSPPLLAECKDTAAARQRFAADMAGAAVARVPGVPYFVFNNRLAISGAQSPAVLRAAMEQALSPVGELQAS